MLCIVQANALFSGEIYKADKKSNDRLHCSRKKFQLYCYRLILTSKQPSLPTNQPTNPTIHTIPCIPSSHWSPMNYKMISDEQMISEWSQIFLGLSQDFQECSDYPAKQIFCNIDWVWKQPYVSEIDPKNCTILTAHIRHPYQSSETQS